MLDNRVTRMIRCGFQAQENHDLEKMSKSHLINPNTIVNECLRQNHKELSLQSRTAGMSNPGCGMHHCGNQGEEEGHGCSLTAWQALKLEDSYVDRAVGPGYGLFHNPVLSLSSWVG